MKHHHSIAAVAFAAALLCAGGASAGTVTLTLPSPLQTDVTDAAGTTSHFTGPMMKGAASVGEFFAQLRTENRASPVFNSGQEHMTLFFAPKAGSSSTAAENLSIDGDHDYGSGGFKGSVSAASNAYAWLKGADVQYSMASGTHTRTVVISWNGSNQLTLP